MKKVATIILTVIILTAYIPVTYAAGDKLAIDNKNVYEGMINSYSQGYRPEVKDGKAIVILPLIYEGANKIVDEKITVTPDLGDPLDSPFSFSNYQMTVSLADNVVNGGKAKVPSFLVRLELPLSANRINGTYPVIINTSFLVQSEGKEKPDVTEQSKDPEEITDESSPKEQEQVKDIIEQVEQTFTVYVTITDGRDPQSSESEQEPEEEPEPRPQPKIIMDEYKVSPQMVMAGDSFDVMVRLKNTEEDWSTYNIKVTYKGETHDILPNDKTNTFYIDEISNNKAHELNLKMRTRLDAEPRPHKILLTIEYEDSARTAYTMNEEILVEVRQPLRLEVDEVNIPSSVNAGESLPITMNIFNMGKSTLYNVRCTLEMPGVIPDGSAYLGNMEPGTSNSTEIYAFFGTLDMGKDEYSKAEVSGDDAGKYGRSEGIMTITYEDEYGEVYTKTVELATNIEKPIIGDIREEQEEDKQKPERASQWWVSIALATGVIMILSTTISYKRKVKKLEMEYGNEDI